MSELQYYANSRTSDSANNRILGGANGDRISAM